MDFVAQTLSSAIEGAENTYARVTARLYNKLPFYVKTPIFKQNGIGLSAIIGFILGAAFGGGFMLFQYSDSLPNLGGFYFALGAYHMLEFLMTAMFHPDTVNTDSFLINQGTEFTIAMTAAFVEFWTEYYFLPGMKSITLFRYIGMGMVIVGQIFRSWAMFTAGHNFTHKVADKKKDEHKLVTSGVYQYMRHPSYFGWFWWSIGTQVLLCNPVCTVGYALASWTFFKDRIAEEEVHLVEFFGEDYENYRKRVGTLIPLIK